MKNLSIILAFILVAMISCTKSKEVHPETGDGNDEIVTVGMKDVHVEYTRTDHAELSRVVFHYSPADANGNAQQFEAAEMTKKETFFELVLDDLICDTLYWYYYELFPNSGDAFNTVQKTFHTQACDTPEPPEPPVAELPTVVTIEVTGITAHSVSCIGEVINDGGAEVTERGVCWSTNENPTLEDNHVAADTGTGTFTATIEGLEANTTYHLRAYATNEAGTAYGLDMKFTTLSNGGSDVPEGAINGLFTINENGDQVYFSQGNLQYQASTNTWRFAENQFSFVGGLDYQTGVEWGNLYENGVKCDNALLSSTYNGWIDLFGWGTSGYHDDNDPYNIHYQPWETVQYAVSPQYNMVGFGPSTNMPSPNLTGSSANYDWGVFNAILNGGNVANQWRTLSKDEWEYIIDSRNTVSGILYAKCMVDGFESIILLPDNWNSSLYDLHNVNSFSASFNSNIITLDTWEEVFANEGVVLLLSTGVRTCDIDHTVLYMRNGLENGGDLLSYWTTTFGDTSAAYCFFFTDYYGGPSCRCARDTGRSVRLVQDVNPQK